MSDTNKPALRRWLWLALVLVVLWGGIVGVYLHTTAKQNDVADISDDVSTVIMENGFGLYIDGVFISACKDRAGIDTALASALNGLVYACGAPLEGEHSFYNDVRVISGEYDAGSFATADAIAAMLGVNGDSFSFSVKDFSGAVTRLALSVSTSLTATVGEVIEKPIVQNATDLLETGVVVIVDEGADGVAQNTYSMTYLNGVLTEKVQSGSTVITEPVAEEHWYGTDSGATLLSADTLFALPYDGRISSPYGYRRLWGKVELHNGIDFVALEGGCYGDPIYAAHDGIVSYSGWRGGYGNAVMIDHTQSLTSLYAHCSKLLVEEGEYVRKGQIIALIGNTGRVTGAHLHYSMFKDGVLCDPTPYLDWSEFKG